MAFRLVKTGKSYSDQQEAPLPRQDNAAALVISEELDEIAARVQGEGYVLLWSAVLQDLIAFYRDEEARSKIPPGFVPYSEAELRELFGDDRPSLSTAASRLIHEAKKHGGYVQ